MLPLRDENPTELTPFFTWLLLGINILVWVMVQGAGTPDALLASVQRYGTYPCELAGRCEAPSVGWPSLLTSMFMHGSWAHLLGNMLFLWVFGNNIEDSMGHLRFLGFYLISGLGAGLAHVLMSPGSDLPAVGASGAISAIMGGYIVLYPRVRVRTWIPPVFFLSLPAVLLLGYWFAIQLVMGLGAFAEGEAGAGGVAVWAHVGGFVIGVLLIKVFEKRELSNAKRNKVQLSREEVARLEW